MTKTEYVLPDEGLVYHPCEQVKGFKTTRELSILNTKNRNCIKQYKVIVDNYLQWRISTAEGLKK